jgi:hypothetical protein
MDSASSRSKRLESAISIFLLAILFLIGFAIFIKQFDFDMSRFGIGAAAPLLSLQGSETGIGAKLSFDSLVPSGFKKLSAAEIYVPENLYEKIDGKATLYIESGFVKLFTQRFVSESDDTLWFEVFLFDMALARNAFSVYSVQKRADAETYPAMQFAYSTSNALYFVQDRFYVELVGSAESADLFGAMAQVADKLTGRLAVGKVTEIPELTLFPQENIVAGSAKLYLSDVFGFDGFRDTFVCRYKAGEEFVTAFLSKRPNSQEARNLADSYYKFLIENGGKAKPTSGETLKPVEGKVLDFYGVTEIIFAIGPYIAGVHEAKNQQSAEKLAAQLIDKLSSAAPTTKND